MEFINTDKTTEILKGLNADETTIELILNNVSQYNDLVKQYGKSNFKSGYLMYQLNVQIGKQIEGLRKVNAKINPEEDDAFENLVKSLKE